MWINFSLSHCNTLIINTLVLLAIQQNMINTSPRFQRTLKIIREPVSDLQHFENANEAFDNKEYKKSLIELITFINPNLLKKEDADKDISFVQGQGSVNVHITVKNKELEIIVPFLKLTEKTNRVALLRKISEVNFDDLMLSQIVLRGDILQFEFKAALELCQPNKIYGVIRRMAIFADNYDDEFASRYNAEFVEKAETTPLSEEEKQKVNEYLDQICEDYKKYSKAFKEKSLGDYQWDIIIVSLLKLGIMPYVNGTLRTDLYEYIYNLLDLDISFNYRLDKGVNFMNKLCSKNREEIIKDMYYAKLFVARKKIFSLQILQDNLRNIDNMVQRYSNKKEYLAMFYLLQIYFLRVIYQYNLEEKYIRALLDALDKTASMKVKEGSKILFDLYQDILNGDLNKKKKDNFFTKLLKFAKIKR